MAIRLTAARPIAMAIPFFAARQAREGKIGGGIAPGLTWRSFWHGGGRPGSKAFA